MLVRGPGLAASMSRYLIDRIEATPNIELHASHRTHALHGEASGGLDGVTLARPPRRRRGASANCATCSCSSAPTPRRRGSQGCGVAVDAAGFVLTGAAAAAHAGGARAPAPLETSIPGVFAVGDVRSGSVKRVGGAIGEGAAAVAQIHARLATEARATMAGGR